MVWGHLLGTAPARGGTCRLRLLCAGQEMILGMKLQSSDLGKSALGPEGLNSTFPIAATAPLGTCFLLGCAQLIDALQRGLRTLLLSHSCFIATVSLGFT